MTNDLLERRLGAGRAGHPDSDPILGYAQHPQIAVALSEQLGHFVVARTDARRWPACGEPRPRPRSDRAVVTRAEDHPANQSGPKSDGHILAEVAVPVPVPVDKPQSLLPRPRASARSRFTDFITAGGRLSLGDTSTGPLDCLIDVSNVAAQGIVGWVLGNRQTKDQIERGQRRSGLLRVRASTEPEGVSK